MPNHVTIKLFQNPKISSFLGIKSEPNHWWVALQYIILDRIHRLFHFLEYLLDLQWWRSVVSMICPLLYFYFLNLPGKIMNGSNYKNLKLSSTTTAGSSVRICQVQSVVRDFIKSSTRRNYAIRNSDKKFAPWWIIRSRISDWSGFWSGFPNWWKILSRFNDFKNVLTPTGRSMILKRDTVILALYNNSVII